MAAGYRGRADFSHGEASSIAILLVNLGTPEAPTASAVRPYLRQFLSDPRVIELPKWKWQLILNLFVLTTRPKKSAEAYAAVWTEHGSPLLLTSEKQRVLLEERLQQTHGDKIQTALGMTYGRPSIPEALQELERKGMRRLLVLPLYPQYSGTTTASVFDAVTRELRSWRWLPEFRMVMNFHDHPLYISALAASVREHWEKNGRAEKLLMSFHGIPKRYFLGGDPYHCQCQKTARLLSEALGLGRDDYIVSFQSLFGKEEWVRPYTDETLRSLPGRGVSSVDVICPGFTGDCLETLEEIEQENRHYFLDAGGKDYRYIRCLNERSEFIDLLFAVCESQMQDWLSEDPRAADEEARRQFERHQEREQSATATEGQPGEQSQARRA